MKLLVEHVLFSPYTGTIYGGAEKSTYAMADALRKRGHQVDIVAPQDSTLDCIKAPVWSGQHVVQHGGVMKMKVWYDFIRELSADYDGIYLNHGMTSQSLLDPRHEVWMSKSAYINRDGSGWYTTGAGGMRLLTNLRWMRYCGGKTYYMSEANRKKLDWVWSHPKKGLEVRGQCCTGGVKRIGHSDFFSTDPFDGQHNQLVFPADAVPARAPEGYLVAIGRPDANKRLHLASEMAKNLGKHLILFTTSRNTSSTGDYHEKVIAKCRSLGAEVRLDVPHPEIMQTLAGADALLLSSRDETFCRIAEEAISHGVPVSAMEVPPALSAYPELIREWGDVSTTTLEERQTAHEYLRQTYTMDAYGARLEALLP